MAVFWAGGEQLTSAIAASGTFVYSSLVGAKATAAPVRAPTAKPGAAAKPTTKPKQAVQAKAAKPAAQAKPAATPKAAAKTKSTSKLIATVEHEGKKIQILDEPIPAECNAHKHMDFDGYAVQWGLGNKAKSAAECCLMCKDFKKNNPTAPHPCHAWVWCGDPSGKCWTMDIHDHTTGDCWLKFQDQWDNNPDLSKSNIKINHRDRFSAQFRTEHKSAPEFVPWMAGLVVQEKKT